MGSCAAEVRPADPEVRKYWEEAYSLIVRSIRGISWINKRLSFQAKSACKLAEGSHRAAVKAMGSSALWQDAQVDRRPAVQSRRLNQVANLWHEGGLSFMTEASHASSAGVRPSLKRAMSPSRQVSACTCLFVILWGTGYFAGKSRPDRVQQAPTSISYREKQEEAR